MWFYRRGRYLNRYYASVSEIADNFSLQKIVGYIFSTHRFNQPWLVEARTTQSTRNILRGKAKGYLGLISQWSYTCATFPYEEEEDHLKYNKRDSWKYDQHIEFKIRFNNCKKCATVLLLRNSNLVAEGLELVNRTVAHVEHSENLIAQR